MCFCWWLSSPTTLPGPQGTHQEAHVFTQPMQGRWYVASQLLQGLQSGDQRTMCALCYSGKPRQLPGSSVLTRHYCKSAQHKIPGPKYKGHMTGWRLSKRGLAAADQPLSNIAHNLQLDELPHV